MARTRQISLRQIAWSAAIGNVVAAMRLRD